MFMVMIIIFIIVMIMIMVIILDTLVRSWIRRGKRQRAVSVVVDEEQMEPVGLIEGRLAGFADVGADI